VTLSAAIQSMTPSQREDLVTKAQAMVKTASDQYDSRFDGSEKDWSGPAPANELYRPSISPGADVALQLAYRTRSGIIQRAVVILEMQRTMLRLLDIHAQILAFRWRNFRLPKDLEEVANGLSSDPFNGKTFIYETLPSGGYDLYSAGTTESGIIRLAPAKPKPTDGQQHQPPPP